MVYAYIVTLGWSLNNGLEKIEREFLLEIYFFSSEFKTFSKKNGGQRWKRLSNAFFKEIRNYKMPLDYQKTIKEESEKNIRITRSL